MNEVKAIASSCRAALIGDVVDSRRATDRADLHRRVTEALGAVAADPPAFTVGDEFQGSYPTVGAAIDAALTVRLALDADIDVRFGIGWGEMTVLDSATGIQDGPGWWSAREAIEWTAAAQQQPALATVRTAYRRHGDTGPDPQAVNAALLCRDHLLGSMDARSFGSCGDCSTTRRRRNWRPWKGSAHRRCPSGPPAMDWICWCWLPNS